MGASMVAGGSAVFAAASSTTGRGVPVRPVPWGGGGVEAREGRGTTSHKRGRTSSVGSGPVNARREPRRVFATPNQPPTHTPHTRFRTPFAGCACTARGAHGLTSQTGWWGGSTWIPSASHVPVTPHTGHVSPPLCGGRTRRDVIDQGRPESAQGQGRGGNGARRGGGDGWARQRFE